MLLRLVFVSLCLGSSFAVAGEAPSTKVLTSETQIAADATMVQTTHYEFRAKQRSRGPYFGRTDDFLQ